MAAGYGMGSFLHNSLTRAPTPNVTNMKNIPSDTVESY